MYQPFQSKHKVFYFEMKRNNFFKKEFNMSYKTIQIFFLIWLFIFIKIKPN